MKMWTMTMTVKKKRDIKPPDNFPYPPTTCRGMTTNQGLTKHRRGRFTDRIGHDTTPKKRDIKSWTSRWVIWPQCLRAKCYVSPQNPKKNHNTQSMTDILSVIHLVNEQNTRFWYSSWSSQMHPEKNTRLTFLGELVLGWEATVSGISSSRYLVWWILHPVFFFGLSFTQITL